MAVFKGVAVIAVIAAACSCVACQDAGSNAARRGARPDDENIKTDVKHGDGQTSHLFWVDPETHLMWATKDHLVAVNWYQAAAYCQNLTTGGFRDWTLPTIDQLEKIYSLTEANIKDYAGAKINLNGCCPWSASPGSSDNSHFYFWIGKRRSIEGGNIENMGSALCVRRAGD